MKATIAIMMTLFLTVPLFGCGSTNNSKSSISSNVQQQAVENNAVPAKQPVQADANNNDKKFVQEMKNSIGTLQKTMEELDVIILETQNNDEADEARESMDIARQEALYQWNKIHNNTKPDSAALKKIKTSYEGILMQLRNGLQAQMDGMQTAEPKKIMDGLELTKKAKNNLKLLAMNVEKEKG